MKNSAQIIGLPIISISDGIQVGMVKALVINPEKGSIDFLTIEHEDWHGSVKAIPFKKVIGIGEFAVTIEGSHAVIDLNEIPIANQLVNKKIKLKNTRVMTRKGELLGEISEYFIDDESGQILGLELKTSNKDLALSSEYVLTYGKDIIIVKEEAAKNFLENILEVGQNGEKPSIIEEPQPAVVVNKQSEPTASKEESQNDELVALKRKQIDLLKGKMVTKTIYDSKGQVLFEAGTKLTPADITKAQDDSPGTVVEVSMNVEA
ncbi:PRC-barrel domain-containing protein [Bacillus tuaregi]|uniref:PRC-barrel domain-containing protein n=1 Tax=Bacillus tuaregi TaxID=1816695 RepID=UPI0008F83977|nr:PRC-barrel domain-containing protein [Bacillus tuaregi]